VLVQ
jgi:hypothetical protein